MSSLILLAIGLVGQWLLGFAISDWFVEPARDVERRSENDFIDDASTFVERAGLGFVLGIGFTAGILMLWSLSGGPLGRGISLAITVAGYVAGGTVLRGELLRRRSIHGAALSRLESIENSAENGWRRFCLIFIACLASLTTVQILLTPQHLWDERASFAIKGIVLSMDGSIHSRDLLDPNFAQFHPRYPLLIPLAEQHIYSLLGRIDDRLAKMVFPMLYLGLVLVMAGGMARELSSGSAWLFAVFMASMPVLVPWEYGFACGQADASMACFHGSSVLYLWISWRRISGENPSGYVRSSILAGVCGAMAAFTKDEGIAFLMVDAIAAALVLPFSRRLIRGLGILLTVFGVAALMIAPWMMHRQRLPLTTEANYFGRVTIATLLQKRANLEWQIPHLVRRMFWEFREWGLQWWLMLFSAVAAPRRLLSCSQLFLALDVIGSILSLIVAGMVAATDVTEHIGESSHRYLMQLAPVAILFAAGQLGQPRRSQTNTLENTLHVA